MHKQQGFTLIELMIVVAIIGILAAIAIPAYQDYTARAQASEAVSLLGGLKTPIVEYYNTNGQAPDVSKQNEIGNVTITGKYVSTISGADPYTATFKGVPGASAKIAGLTIQMDFVPSTGNFVFTCDTNMDAAIKPKLCQ